LPLGALKGTVRERQCSGYWSSPVGPHLRINDKGLSTTEDDSWAEQAAAMLRLCRSADVAFCTSGTDTQHPTTRTRISRVYI